MNRPSSSQYDGPWGGIFFVLLPLLLLILVLWLDGAFERQRIAWQQNGGNPPKYISRFP